MIIRFNKLSSKFMAVCAVFIAISTSLLWLYVSTLRESIREVSSELVGSSFLRTLETTLLQVSMHRWYESRRFMGEKEASAKLKETEDSGDFAVSRLLSIWEDHDDVLKFSPDDLAIRNRQHFTVASLIAQWSRLKGMSARGVARKYGHVAIGDEYTYEDIDQAHVELIRHINVMIVHTGDSSRLNLDSDLDARYMVDLVLSGLPGIQARLQEVAVFVSGVKVQRSVSADQKKTAAILASLLQEVDIPRVKNSASSAISEDRFFYGISPLLKNVTESGLEKTTAAIDDLTDLLQEIADYNLDSDGVVAPSTRGDALERSKASEKKTELPAYDSILENAIDQSYIFHSQAFDRLDDMLATRMASIKEKMTNTIAVTVIFFAIAMVLAMVLTLSVIRRIARLSKATENMAEGKRNDRIPYAEGQDELVVLGESFNVMADKVSKLHDEVVEKNAKLTEYNANLNSQVNARTREIKCILDNVSSGFLMIDVNGSVLPGFSKSCRSLLGESVTPGADLLALLGLKKQDEFSIYSELISQSFENDLPTEMTIGQLPKELTIAGKTISLSASLAVNEHTAAVESILLSFSDVTERRSLEKKNQETQILIRILKNIDIFKKYISDVKYLLEAARQAYCLNDLDVMRGAIHTLKGNSSTVGLKDVADFAAVAEDCYAISLGDFDEIERLIQDFLKKHFDVLGVSWTVDEEAKVAISVSELDSLVGQVSELLDGKEGHSAVTNFMSDWAVKKQYVSASSLMGNLSEYASEIASKAGKICQINVLGGNTMVDKKTMGQPIGSLIHVVNNAVDHGIEMPSVRTQVGKQPCGQIEISFIETISFWTITVKDDGAGIDLTRLTQKAIQSGAVTKQAVDKMTNEEMARLVFVPGLSTAKQDDTGGTIHSVSGQGIGMAAVESTATGLGGKIDIKTCSGKGTSTVISIPKNKGKISPIAKSGVLKLAI